MALMAGPYFHGVGTFIKALDQEFPTWGRGVLSGAFSLSRIDSSILGPIAGFLTDRLRPARMILVGYVIMGVGWLILSVVHHPVVFYVAFITIATGSGLGGFIPAMVSVNYWFNRRRSTAMALVMAGSSLGGLLVPFLAWGISNHGWRTAALGIGIVLAASALPLSRVLSRFPRAGETASEEVRAAAPKMEARGKQAQAAATQGPEFTAKQALKTRAFWLLAAAHTAGNVSIVAVAVHGVPHLTDMGLSLELAGTVVAMYTASSLAFQVFGGFIGDRVDKRVATWAFITLQGISMLVFAFTTNLAMASVFALLYGIGFGGRGPVMNALRADYFGRKAFGAILGMSSVPMNIGMVISPLVLGILFDVQDTYKYGMLGLGFVSIAGAFMALLATKPKLQAAPAAGEARLG